MQSYDSLIGTTLDPLFFWLYVQIPVQYRGGGGGCTYNVCEPSCPKYGHRTRSDKRCLLYAH
jgi:hypothetical protein